MPLDESFPAEAPEAHTPVAEVPVPAPEPAPQPAAEVLPPAPAEVPAGAPAEPVAPPVAAEAPVDAPPAPAFDEKAYLKTLLGDDAPETADEARARIAADRAKVVTPEMEAQLAILKDGDKLREYAALSGRDYDKPTAAEIMREKFALDNPTMSEAQVDRRFSKQFAEKYPTLADALEHPENYAADDPALLAEKEDADYDAQADRLALKTNQQTKTQEFLATAQAAAAPTAPQYTPAQVAEAQAVVKWADETFKDGATLPIDVGNGQVLNMPIGEAASFKEGFANVDKLYTALVQTPEGTINRDMQAKIALFLRDPKGYDTFIANGAKAASPPAIPVPTLTNSSAQHPRPPVAAPAPTPLGAEYSQADDWKRFNV